MLVITNGQISSGEGNNTKEVTIWVDGGKIHQIDEGDIIIPKDAEVIDASGCIVLPGAIDPHVHFNTPGYESHEDFAHGTKAAAAGGVTTVVDMPDTSIPPVVNLKNLDTKLEVISKQAYVDFALWGGVSKNLMLEEDWFGAMNELHEAGVVGFKIYMFSGMDTFQDLPLIMMGQVMQNASQIGALVALHAEEKDIVTSRVEALQKENKNELKDYYFSRSDPVEQQGIAAGIYLAHQTNAKLHIVHLGSGEGERLIGRAKDIGMDISCETCPHYLAFTYKDFEKYGSFIKTAPVVKTEKDRDALWEGLKDKTIDFVSTDHAPSSREEKETGSCWADYNGISGVQYSFPYIFSEAYMKKEIDLARLIEITSKNAAKRFGLYPQKGATQVGSDADFVIVDPAKISKVDEKKAESKAKWTPFNDRSFVGEIQKTIVRGKIVYDCNKGVVGKSGYGKWVKRIVEEKK